MRCPIPSCDAEFLTDEELSRHIFSDHREYGPLTAGLFEQTSRIQVRCTLAGVAAALTMPVYPRDKTAQKEAVWGTFLWFYKQLCEML